jgi:hypothetical protein
VNDDHSTRGKSTADTRKVLWESKGGKSRGRVVEALPNDPMFEKLHLVFMSDPPPSLHLEEDGR